MLLSLAENESDEDKSESESGGSTDLESDIDTVNESEDGKNARKCCSHYHIAVKIPHKAVTLNGIGT